MKTQKKLWFLVFVTLIILLCGTGCGAEISTSLNIDNNFSGTRVMTCVVSKSDAEESFQGGIAGVDEIINQRRPESLTCERTEDESSVTYILTLAFSSFEDYKAKVEALLGRTSEMVFQQPDSVFSSGISLTEDFDSRDLLGWFKAAVEENNLISDISNLWELSGTKVVYAGEEISTNGTIKFDRIQSNPITGIQIETTGTDALMERKIFFDMPTQARDNKKDEVDAYMASLIPEGSNGTWLTTEEGYCYEITFSAASTEELSNKMKVVFGETYVCEETLNEEDPFVTIKTFSENFGVVQFGNTSGKRIRVNYIYNIEEKENRTIQAVNDGWTDNNQYKYERSTDNVAVSFSVRDVVNAKDITVHLTSDIETFDAVIDISFEEGQETTAEKVAKYYDSLWEDVTAKVDTKKGVICRIEVLAKNCSVKERLSALLGSSSVTFDVSVEEKLLKNTCNITANIYLGYLAQQVGISEGTGKFILELEKYDFQEVSLNYTVLEDIKGKNTIESENVYSIYLTASAEKTNLVGILVMVGIILVIIVALAVGFVFLVKYLSKRDGLDEEPMSELMKIYGIKGLKYAKVKLIALAIAIWHGIRWLVKYIKHILENYYPENSHKKIIDYFFGSRIPVYIILVSCIAFPVGWAVIACVIKVLFINPIWKVYAVLNFIAAVTAFITMVQWISIPVALIWYFVDKFKTNPEVEAEYDRVFAEDLEKFKDVRGLQALGLDVEQIALVEPLKLVGPDYDMKEQQLKRWASLWRKIRRFFIYEGRLVVKQGADGKVRYSCASQNIWYFSENQLYRYEINYDLCTGQIRAESTCENFYQNISYIATKEKVVKIRKYFTLIPQVYQSFIVETKSGNSMSAVVDSGFVRNEEITSTIKAMESLARDKKAVVASKKNKRGNRV